MKQCINENTPRDRDILLWDTHAGRWEVGHWRALAYLDAPGHYMADWVAGYREDADELVTDGEPLFVFESVTHWHELPGDVQ